jgi:hypothetical protein
MQCKKIEHFFLHWHSLDNSLVVIRRGVFCPVQKARISRPLRPLSGRSDTCKHPSRVSDKVQSRQIITVCGTPINVGICRTRPGEMVVRERAPSVAVPGGLAPAWWVGDVPAASISISTTPSPARPLSKLTTRDLLPFPNVLETGSPPKNKRTWRR